MTETASDTPKTRRRKSDAEKAAIAQADNVYFEAKQAIESRTEEDAKEHDALMGELDEGRAQAVAPWNKQIAEAETAYKARIEARKQQLADAKEARRQAKIAAADSTPPVGTDSADDPEDIEGQPPNFPFDNDTAPEDEG